MQPTTQKIANYTGNGWEGKNYTYAKSTKECAAEIRQTVRKLWPTKEGYRIGVKYNSYSMGSSIDITIKAAPFRIFRPEYTALYKAENWQEIRRLQDERRDWQSVEHTNEAIKLKDELTKLGNGFRMDDSDGMIDYFHTNFYLHVGYHWELDKDQ